MTAKRGRKSAAELSVVSSGGFDHRPDPPANLTPRQADIWKETVASEAADFFKTAALQALLTDYCHHRESAEILNSTIHPFTAEDIADQEGVDHYRKLLRMRDNEVKSAAQLATKLRLTNQSRYVPHAAATASRRATAAKKPWES